MQSLVRANPPRNRIAGLKVIGIVIAILTGTSLLLYLLSSDIGKPGAGLSATSQPAADVADENETPPGSNQPSGVRFVVKDDAGQPVGGASLFIITDDPGFPVISPDHPPQSTILRCDHQGNASDAAFPRVTVNVLATAPRFAPLFLRAIQPQSATPYLLTLHAGAQITGHVTDQNGHPLPGVALTAVQTDSPVSYMDELKLRATSDAAGAFAMPHAADGKYSIVAELPKGAASLSIDPALVEVSAARASGPVELKARGGSVLTGTYVGPIDAKLGGREIYLSTRQPARSSRSIKTADDGTFTVPGISAAASGQITFMRIHGYDLHIEWPDAPPTFHLLRGYMRFANVAAGNYTGIVVRMVQEGRATGTITDEAGKPVVGVWVEFCPSGQEDGNEIFKTNASGHYQADVPAQEPVRMKVEGEGIVESQEGEPFTIQPGKAFRKDMQTRRIVYPPHDNRIAGRVLDSAGEPVAQAQVSLGNYHVLPEDLLEPGANKSGPHLTWSGGDFGPATTQTDASGSYSFNELRQGKTDVWAYSASSGWALIQNVPTGTADARLVLAPQNETIFLAGSILGSDGKPVGACRVVVFNAMDPQREMLVQSQTDEAGHFRIQMRPPWDYDSCLYIQLIVLAPDGRMAWKTLPIMSLDGLRIPLKPPARVSGRIVDSSGRAAAGATVRLALGQDPDFGQMNFGRNMYVATPTAQSGPDGRFVIPGLPLGSTASLYARTPISGEGYSWYIKNLAAEQEIPDITLPDGITVQGTVRLASTGQPVAGAAVTLDFEDDYVVQRTTSDAQGHYRIVGLDPVQLQIARTFMMRAATGAGSTAMEGSTQYASELYAGEAATGVDVLISTTYEALHAAWIARPAKAAPSRCRLALLDHIDPPITGRARPQDALTLYDGSGRSHRLLEEMNSCDNFVVDPRDGSIWVSQEHGFSKFHADGSLAWSKDVPDPGNFALDPRTGNAWVLSGGETIYQGNLLVLDPAGNLLSNRPIHGQDIAYSAADDCFWVVSQTAQKVSREGKLLAESQLRFAFRANSVAVNQKDGSVWICEARHPEIPQSKSRLVLLGPDAQLRKSISCAAYDVAIDDARGVAWAVGQSLTKLDATGNILLDAPLSGGSVAIEPDTGCIWVIAGNQITRVNSDGAFILGLDPSGRSPRCLAIIPP